MKSRTRLHKYIANCGYTSRRRAELLIQAGRVLVNGRRVTSLGSTIDPDADEITINGDSIRPPERITILFHKPGEVITSTHDTHDRLTVMDLLPRRFRELGVFPVGRLDQETEGLLILTNDGDLHHQIAHPSHEIEKEYVAEVSGRPGDEVRRLFQQGLVLDGERTAPARILSIESSPKGAVVAVVITEGRKRQVRRMFEAAGHPVIHLRRVRVGNLPIGDLPRGEWRNLEPDELAALLGGEDRAPHARKGGAKLGAAGLDGKTAASKKGAGR